MEAKKSGFFSPSWLIFFPDILECRWNPFHSTSCFGRVIHQIQNLFIEKGVNHGYGSIIHRCNTLQANRLSGDCRGSKTSNTGGRSEKSSTKSGSKNASTCLRWISGDEGEYIRLITLILQTSPTENIPWAFFLQIKSCKQKAFPYNPAQFIYLIIFSLWNDSVFDLLSSYFSRYFPLRMCFRGRLSESIHRSPLPSTSSDSISMEEWSLIIR